MLEIGYQFFDNKNASFSRFKHQHNSTCVMLGNKKNTNILMLYNNITTSNNGCNTSY